jgi:trans-aconitate methyltransferase
VSENVTTGATFADPGAATEWEAFYREGNYDRIAYIGRDVMPDLLGRFISDHWPPTDERPVDGPDSVASIGCGAAVDLFALADRFPATEFYGYDVSESVITDNRRIAAEFGYDNVHFDVDALPDLTTDRRFDLVYCMATLYFVADADSSVEHLYERVEDGGYLVFNYPNRYTRARFDREFDGARRTLFEHVISGANLLSYRRIADLLGRRPQDYWRIVDARDYPFVERYTPCVVVKK